MKTRILGRVREQSGEWLAEAFKGEEVFCSVSARSELEVLDRLKAEIQRELVTFAQPWLKRWQRSPSAVNCPESTVKLPIDIWYCKLEDKACPIQGQVSLDYPEAFFEGCFVSGCAAVFDHAKSAGRRLVSQSRLVARFSRDPLRPPSG